MENSIVRTNVLDIQSRTHDLAFAWLARFAASGARLRPFQARTVRVDTLGGQILIFHEHIDLSIVFHVLELFFMQTDAQKA